jgi:hypothetical protein
VKPTSEGSTREKLEALLDEQHIGPWTSGRSISPTTGRTMVPRIWPGSAWAGVVPLAKGYLPAVPAPDLADGIIVPDSVMGIYSPE